MAYQYRRAAFNVLDLIQEGNIGLMQAVKKFDPATEASSSRATPPGGSGPTSFATSCGQLPDGEARHHPGAAEALLQPAQGAGEAGGPRASALAPKLLAESLNVSERDVEEMQTRMGNEELSLDAPVGARDGEQRQTGLDRIPTDGVPMDDALADAELKEQFHEQLKAFGCWV